MIFLSLAIFQTVICDHMRAPEYYIASVQNNCSWKAFPCHSLSDCEAGKNTTCDGKCPSMGYDADKTDLTGNYYLKTNSNPPFCGMLVFILFFHMVLQHHWLVFCNTIGQIMCLTSSLSRIVTIHKFER